MENFRKEAGSFGLASLCCLTSITNVALISRCLDPSRTLIANSRRPACGSASRLISTNIFMAWSLAATSLCSSIP